MRRGVLPARVSPRCSRAHAPRLMKSKQSWWPGGRSTLPVKELVHESRGLVESKQSWSPAQDRCLSSPRGCGCGMKPKHKVGRPGPGSARVVAAAVAASAAAVAARRGAEDAVSAACGRGFREGSRSGLGQPSATWEGREAGGSGRQCRLDLRRASSSSSSSSSSPRLRLGEQLRCGSRVELALPVELTARFGRDEEMQPG